MLSCPNCAGNLTFDIETQKLKCDHCATLIEPYEYRGEKAAEESEVFGVTRYTCTQCGAEIYATDESVTGTCSYCGSGAFFEGRLSDEQKPAYIIPFSQTKNHCMEAYRKQLRRALFAPKEMRDPKFIEKFTGVYVPYWVYEFDLKEEIELRGYKTERKGDYIVNGRYRLTGNADSSYHAPYDASSYFHDSMADDIAPFKIKDMQPFSPVFLSGFHADTADVDSDTYLQDAKNQVGSHAYQKLLSMPAFQTMTLQNPASKGSMDRIFGTDNVETKRALFPVWFLTWRNKNRVAYAVMNGQTGKLAVDIPLSVGRFFIGSLLLAVPLFYLFYSTMIPTPSTALTLTALIGAGFALAYQVLYRRMTLRNDPEADVGYRAKKFAATGKTVGKPVKSHFQAPKLTNDQLNRGDSTRGELYGHYLGILINVLIFVVGFGYINFVDAPSSRRSSSRSVNNTLTPAPSHVSAQIVIGAIVMVAAVGLTIALIVQLVKSKKFRAFLEGLFVHAALFFAGRVLYTQPVSDLPYYVAQALLLAGSILSFAGLVRMYNLSVTRPVPELFVREGETS